MKLEDAKKEYTRLKLISKRSRDSRYYTIARSLLDRIQSRYLLTLLSEKETSDIVKMISKESSSFHIILKRNIIREYGNIVYVAWSKDFRNNT